MEEDDLPPPYTPAPSADLTLNTTAAPIAATTPPTLFASYLSTHLSTLSSRIRASQAARTTAQAARDLDLITLLAPEVESFLSDLGSTSSTPAPPLAELVLVPAAAVPSSWVLSGAQERRREGEVVQLVRVRDPRVVVGDRKGGKGGGGGGGGDKKEASSSAAPAPTSASTEGGERDWGATQFDEWGRWGEDSTAAAGTSSSSDADGTWWWRDEAMAHRLASYLQPKATKVAVDRKTIQTTVQQRRVWGWGRKRAPEPSSATAAPSVPQGRGEDMGRAVPVVGPAPEDDRVSMTVRAEEVTFRRENEFGVWESMSGWGVVVRVRIRRT